MNIVPRNRTAFATTGCLFALLFMSPATGAQEAHQPPAATDPTAADPAAQADRDVPGTLQLTAGKSLVVVSKLPMERIAVGFGDVAEATAIGPRELLLNGKTPGVTSLIIWQQGGSKQVFDVTVVASHFIADSRVEAIRSQLERELPGQKIDLSFDNETAFLRGSVKDMISADRAVSIASTLGKTVNLLYVETPLPEPQILLKVKFASIDRNISTQLGMNIFSTGAGNTIGTLTTQQFSPPTVSVVPNTPVTATISDALNLFLLRSDLNLGATIKALEIKGLLQILAEPNVLTQNGTQGSFLAGGEFPFPSVSGGGAGSTPVVSIQFREFGVRLTFTPTVTPRGTIQLQVAPEVSALDFTNGLSVSGFNVPALTTRKVRTQVELSDGQSFAIAGLLDNRTTDTFEKIPFIGDIPILGKFFQSKNVSKQNTELIVIVTPVLVRPIQPDQPLPQLKYPTPFMKPNTDPEQRMPASETTSQTPAATPEATIPVEKLRLSLQPVAPQTVSPVDVPVTAPTASPH